MIGVRCLNERLVIPSSGRLGPRARRAVTARGAAPAPAVAMKMLFFGSGCMQAYCDQPTTVHPDALRARVCGARRALVRCTRPRGRPGDFFSQAPGNPSESLLDFFTDSESP